MPYLHAALAAVQRWARTRYGAEATADILHHCQVSGGETSNAALAVHMLVNHRSAESERVDVFWKLATPGEARALRALMDADPALRPAGGVMPELLAHGVIDRAPWVLLPFYTGSTLMSSEDAPLELVEGLAAMHAHFQRRPGLAAGLPKVTADRWKRQCRAAARAARLGDTEHTGVGERIAQLLDDAVEHTCVDRALGLLPATLIHGDVHEHNVLVSQDQCRLIDWGNARLGPGMLDVANIAAPGSVLFNHYAHSLARRLSLQADARLMLVGYEWAQVQICTQYLPYIVRAKGLQAAFELATRMQASLRGLSSMLDRVGMPAQSGGREHFRSDRETTARDGSGRGSGADHAGARP
jgi:aminoglycoside phosphotransferase (APT) family kinase protein